MLDVFLNVYPSVNDILEIIQKSFWVVNGAAVFPTILDLVKACELKIKYTYALTLSDILCNSTSVKHYDFSIIQWVIESGPMQSFGQTMPR